MSSNNFPPVHHLPHWTRIGSLSRTCSPLRPLATQLKQLPVLPPPVDRDRGQVRVEETTRRDDTDPRIASLERNIQFLQQQHKDTLGKLHTEIEYLRRENKELQYKLIMESPKSSRKGLTNSRRGMRPPTQGSEACMGIYLEEQLQDTRPQQDQAVSCQLIWIASEWMMSSFERARWIFPSEENNLRSIEELSETLGSSRQDHGPELKGGLITSLQPLRIHSSPSHPPRAPTLQECEVIIRQLYNANSLQSQEIIRVKAVLRDIVLSKKITPENYILTKTYLADGTRKYSEVERLPKLGLQTFPEKVTGPSQSGVILPALKQTFSTDIAERQRRTRAVQRNRFKRTVH